MLCEGELQLKASEVLIDTQQELDRISQEITDIVGIDTEFYVRRTFFRIPCLLQISTTHKSYVVDLAAPLNLRSIENLVHDSSTQKVLHASGEDLKILYYIFGDIPSDVVDTQLAHAFVSPEDQRSYHGVVQEYLKFELNQSSSITTSNWSSRPLSKRQIQYAIDDVQHLLPLWESLLGRLKAKGRLEWFQEEMQIYLESQRKGWSFDLSNVQGLRRLDKSDQSLAVMLSEWRESLAKRTNVPRRWVATDDQLVWSVRNQGESVARFRKEMGTRMGERLHKVTRNALRTTRGSPQKSPSPHFVSHKFNKRSSVTNKMKEIVKSKSDELEISRNLLGNLGNLLEWSNFFSHSGSFPASFGRWREELLGPEFREVLG